MCIRNAKNAGAKLQKLQMTLREWPDKECNPSPGNWEGTFQFNSLTNTTYPGVHETILTLALRPKLGLWWLNSVLGPILGVLTMLTKLHVTHQV